MPFIRCAGSWQRWQASRLGIGTTVRRTVPPLVSRTRLDSRCAGGRRWHDWQVAEPNLQAACLSASGTLE